ncbi:right-handed parallel beta-helix repeat-containing protein [Neolewinella agarilytica]|uniref:Por secretion system C-terminal sorting domain-containing protein n=1 Tax=Neolewinella agarilytica TaxID=478744 RepID=A0A1H9JVA1_9BACT|nr:right-handed parallel beta-helix repeat-containing protein [Neolewinella agarilytica]SEQ90694.1 Por secretion system C-terminal sorting domain-containing protein [Neolewinella agarilytica]
MHKGPGFILAIFFFFSCALSAAEYHVSKTGSDDNDGTAAAPFLTIGKAAGLAVAGDIVIIHEGTYEEMLRPANSGSPGNPITFRAAGEDRVILTAMQALNGFTADGNSRFKTTIDWDLKQENFVMNGATAMDLARWPDNTDGNPFTLNSLRNDSGSPGETEFNAFLTDSDIPDFDWTGGSILFYGDRPGSGWTTWKAFITSSSAGRVNFDLEKNQDWIRTFHPPADGGDYFLEGIKEVLDYQNEWWFDEASKTLYVQLPGGEQPADGQVQMRRRSLVVDLKGKDYISLENFAIFGGKVEIEGRGNRLYGMSSFYGSYTRGITRNFHAESRAVDVKWNAVDTRIEHCEIGFGAGTGIWDSGSGTTIENNYIHDFNFIGDYDAPLMVRGQNNALVLKNTITNGGRDGIQIISKNSRVGYNDISNSNLIADDCALLYTIGTGLNMEIDHNWFHDAYGRGDLKKAAGIYLDNDPEGVRVHHNVVYDTEWSSVQINWNGKDLDIFNNTLWDGSKAFDAWHKPGTAFSNVKIWNTLTNSPELEPQSDKQNNVILASGASPFMEESGLDFSLVEGSSAIDAGREISGITDGFQGAAPDAGAYESGRERWLAGVDWDITRGAASRCYNLPGEDCSRFPVSINDPARTSDRTIELFPNPADDKVFFRDLKLHDILRIFDARGRLVKDNIRSNDFFDGVDISGLAPGLYLVTDGKAGLGKFVKQ